jgi:hypothetical protein
MCVLIFFTILSETFLTLRINERDMIQHVYWSSCDVSFLLSDFNKNLDFRVRFSNKTQITSLLKICPVEADLYHAEGQMDGQTDMTKLLVALCNFANAPKCNHTVRSYHLLVNKLTCLTVKIISTSFHL